jgi:orotidine-5'-phosphate decarboxylase
MHTVVNDSHAPATMTYRTTMEHNDKILFALDVPTRIDAERYVTQLQEHVGGFKVGLELFLAAGPAIVQHILRSTRESTRTLLDLKLHDIPETVERSVLRAGDMGVKMLTLHVQQRETMRRAVAAAEKYGMRLVAVPLLTSMTEKDCDDLRYNGATCRPAVRASYLAKLAWESGITGLVASPQEVKALRATYPKAVLVVPGVRPGLKTPGDQKRIGTPEQAVQDGADYLVVGRPIRDAADPVAMAQLIASELVGTPALSVSGG